MAARLTRDRARADDVTQSVFILLAQKAKTLHRHVTLSSWLFTVTRYACKTAQRSETRRRFHERKAALMGEEMATAPAAEWQQLAPLLDELVARLRDADRQAVLLRFYEQKSFSQIGHTLQISEEAARKRVSRSIENLRSLFAQRGVTVGAAALATAMSAQLTQPASAALIAGSKAVSASTAPPALVHSTGAMLTWISIKPIAAAIVAVLALSAVAVTLLQMAPASQSVASPTSAPTTAPQSSARYGRVVTQDDVPVAGARIWQIDYSRQLDRDHVVAATTADSAGRFQFPIVGENTKLLVRAPNFAWAGGTLRSTSSDDPDDIRVVAGTALRVKLLDPEGKPAAGVAVQLTETLMPFRRIWAAFPVDLMEPGIVQTSDADGMCVFKDLPQGGKAYVEVADERFVRRSDLYYDGLELTYTDQSDGGTIRLKTAATIAGTAVIGAGGTPVKGLRVSGQAKNSGGWGRVLTDEQGRYELKQLPPAQYKISLELTDELKRRYAAPPIDQYLAAGMHLTEQNLTLVNGGIVRGRITERDSGQPLKEIGLFAESAGFVSAKTDSDGAFLFHVSPGKQHVSLFAPPAGLTLIRPASYDVVVEDGKTIEVNFQLARGNATAVTGRVVDTEGRPVSGAEIHVEPSQRSGVGDIVTATDSAGNFSIATVDAGSQLRARKGKMTTISPTLASGQNLTLVLHRNAQSSIHVLVNQEDGTPLANVRVQLSDTLGNDTYDEKVTGADGSCLFKNVDPDMTYRVRTWGAGVGTAQANVQVQPGKQTDVPPFRLRRADSALSGIVLDEAGNPKADIKVTMMTRYWATEAHTDIAGRFAFKGLVAGERVQLRAENDDHSLSGELRSAGVPADDVIITVQPAAAKP